MFVKDAVEDSKYYSLAGKLAARQAGTLATVYSDLNFHALDSGLKSSFASGRGLDWVGLGRQVGTLWRSVPAIQFMYVIFFG